jgi:hypothetical protein
VAVVGILLEQMLAAHPEACRQISLALLVFQVEMAVLVRQQATQMAA